MSYTTEGQPQGIPFLCTNLLREALIGELVAINGYTYHIAHSPIKDLNEIWYHIMEDEKRHYGMFLQLLRKYDPIQKEKYNETLDHIKFTSKGNLDVSSTIVKYDKYKILNNIRNDIKGELEAVILYEQQVSQIPIIDVKQVFNEIIADEKEHTEELTLALLHYDKNKYGPISK